MNPILTLLDDSGIRGGRLWTYIFLAHGMAAGFWWWMMPGGFPWLHSRFWMNQVLPLIVMATAVIGGIGISTKRINLAKPVLFAVLGFWTALVPIACLTFPISVHRFGIPAEAILGAVWLSFFLRSPRGDFKRSDRVTFMSALLIGGSLPFVQRAPEPSVTPLNQPLPVITAEGPASKALQLPSTVRINSIAGIVTVLMNTLSIEISPLLSFESRSPDRCWTIFATANDRSSPKRILQAEYHSKGFFACRFTGDASHVLEAWANDTHGDCRIESFTQLDNPVYSHLNSFCALSISGHQRLSISFSPCPEVRVEVEPSDYPVGRPARFAYLDATSIFHVVEATSGEKGPFKNLASGPLQQDDELKITLYDDTNLVGTVTFTDWASQSSTRLSPTAGWGVPMNAIEFSRANDAPNSSITIWMTLAGTSVGRGWDSVGHSAGTYRNRIRVNEQIR